MLGSHAASMMLCAVACKSARAVAAVVEAASGNAGMFTVDAKSKFLSRAGTWRETVLERLATDTADLRNGAVAVLGGGSGAWIKDLAHVCAPSVLGFPSDGSGARRRYMTERAWAIQMAAERVHWEVA